jgi:hypothetical protein
MAAPFPVTPFPLTSEASVHELRHAIDLSAPIHGVTQPRTDDNRAILLSHSWESENSTETQGLSVGPLRIGSGDQIGRHVHLAHFRVEGVTILGGSVGGSLDGRSANIVLSWPANP